MDHGPDSDRLIGEVIASRYRIEARVGDGAMGAVYRARHVKVGRPFAIKVLRPHLLGDETLRRRFLREAELAGKLHHPNVVGMVDIGETSTGLCYLVMEYAPGETLYDLLVRAAPMSGARVGAIVRQLCDGLAHAHDHGLIHRDFKPENVVVERDGHGADRIKIIDFGIAILRDEAESSSPDRLTTAGMVLGTPHYMAPEQALGQAIDHRVDLFALGVMCFEMLTGRAPFDGDGVDVARANVALDTPAMRDRAPEQCVDPLLEAFTRRLMSKSRDARPASASAARVLLDLIDRDPAAAAVVLGVELPARPPSELRISVRPPTAPELVIDAPSEAVRHTPVNGVPADVLSRGLKVGELATLASSRPRAETTARRAAMAPRTAIAAIAIAAVAAFLIVAVVIAALRPREPAPPRAAQQRGGAAQELSAPAQPDVAQPSTTTAPTAAASPTAAAAGRAATTVALPVATTATITVEPLASAPGRAATLRVAARVADRPALTGSPSHDPGAPLAYPRRAPDASPEAPLPAEPSVAAGPPPTVAAAAAPPLPGAPASPALPPASADARSVAQLYGDVGRELKVLDQRRGAAADLWPAYLRIRINDVISDPVKREEADAQLRRLHTLIARRGVEHCDTAAGSTAPP